MITDPLWRKKRLLGCSLSSGSPRLAELGARLGFDAVWIELEHTSADLATAEQMCVAAEAGGAIPLVRTCGSERDQVLHALEIGGKIVVVPLVNDAATARAIVRHGKFRPLGERGFNTRSRGLGFGIDPQALGRANEATCLLPQIETRQAAENLDAILAVPGIGGIFIGPGDLSADLGKPAQFDNPELHEVVGRCIRRARELGKHAGILTGEGPVLDVALAAGADLAVLAADIAALIKAWQPLLEKYRLGG